MNDSDINGPESDDPFVDVSLPPEAPSPASPEPLKFQPWHKPRKQYVRAEQWMKHIRGVVDKLGGPEAFADGQPLRYLTLPGPDLLDIRMVADYCTSASIKLRYTGFCYSTESEEQRLRQNVSEFSITHKDAVVNTSKVVRKRLQDVGIRNSDAFLEMNKGGPFDVINIDACEPLASGDQNESGRLVDTIRTITEFQLRERQKPWLLLLTTPIQLDNISKESLTALHGEVIKNTQNDADFATELTAKFDSDDTSVPEYLNRISGANGDGLISVFALGLAKWLIHLAEQAGFKVYKFDGYCYSMFQRPPYEPNMVSLCFMFDPKPKVIEDKTGLTANPVPPPPNQTPPVSLHLKALRKSFAIQNLDITLQSDITLTNTLIQQTKELLAAVGYSTDEYDAWWASQAQLATQPDQVA